MKKITIILILSFIFIGCATKKTIELDSISLIHKDLLEEEYKKNNYIKTMGYTDTRCITSLSMLNKDLKILSDTFLKINFYSNEKLLIDNGKVVGQYVGIHGDNIWAPINIGFCPIVNVINGRYNYTYFYPTKTKFIYNKNINDIKKVNKLTLEVGKTGSLSKGIIPAMHTNKIVITKEEIDKLF